jgi:hypothetical protein
MKAIILIVLLLFMHAPAAAQELPPLEEGMMRFSWDANTEDDLAGYRLYKGQGTDPPLKIGEDVPTGTTHIDVPYEEHGEWWITAFDISGNVSEKSNVIDTIPPASPKTLRRIVETWQSTLTKTTEITQ